MLEVESWDPVNGCPVAAASKLSSSKWGMCLSNDCFWLHGELAKVLSSTALHASTRSKLAESHNRLNLLGECWYDETIVS